MKTHNKLVRDHIPEIIRNNGGSCSISTLNDADYLGALKKKLIEESQEVASASTREEITEELADVLEVIDAIKKCLDIPTEDIQTSKTQKAKKNGAFDKKLFLESTWK